MGWATSQEKGLGGYVVKINDTYKSTSIQADQNLTQLLANPAEVLASVKLDKIWKSVYTQRDGAIIKIAAKREQTSTGNQRIGKDTNWMACLNFDQTWICSKFMQFKPVKKVIKPAKKVCEKTVCP